jgi:flagellar hook assembly protein FlgD
MLGRLVKALVNSMQEPGVRTIQWDATNEEGNRVSAGVYIYKLKAGDLMETKEMILLK